MKQIAPFDSLDLALTELDNGGRFYNLFTQANDSQITTAELAKAAGVFSDKQNMMLFLEMSLLDLDANAKKKVFSYLSNDLQLAYKKYQPKHYSTKEAIVHSQASEAAIVTGIPKLLDSKTPFKGFILVPIIANNVTTFTMIPIFDQYDVYELRDEESDSEFFIAHQRGSEKLAPQLTRCAGIIKELKADKKEQAQALGFLEIVYFTPLS